MMQLIFVYLVSIFAYEMGKRIENIGFLSVYNINKFRGFAFDKLYMLYIAIKFLVTSHKPYHN